MSDTETVETEPTTRPRLERAKSGRMVAGVCEGLGRYFDIDPVIFRIGFVVATIAGGAGLFAYVAAVLVIPEEGSKRAIIHLGRHTPTWVPWILLGVGVLALADGFDHDGFPFGWGLFALLAAAWFIWGGDHRRSYRPPSGAPPADPLLDASPAHEPPPAPRSILGRLTLSVLLVAGGVALAVAQGRDDVSGLDVEAFLGGALVVVALALLVGTWWGRGRPLIALGIVLTIGAAAASVVDVPLRGGIGERRWAPLAEVRPEYRLGIGDAELDLRRIDDDVTTDITLGIGHLQVIVPRDATVVVDAHAGAGELVVLGRTSNGTDLDERVRSRGSELGPEIRLDVRLGVGQLEVLRDPS